MYRGNGLFLKRSHTISFYSWRQHLQSRLPYEDTFDKGKKGTHEKRAVIKWEVTIYCLNVAEICTIERMHSCVLQPCEFIGTKGSVYIRLEFNSHMIGLVNQHGCRVIVLQHQYGFDDVMCIYAPYVSVVTEGDGPVLVRVSRELTVLKKCLSTRNNK